MTNAWFIARLRNWAIKGGFSILDQGFYSGVNFLLNILLARWISPEMYGGFSAAYSLFLLISMAQVALIAEPMSVFGADKYRQNASPYLNYLLRIQWIGAAFGALLAFLSSLFMRDHVLRSAMISMSVALPFILLYWYLRRAFYIEMESGLAMVTSFVYAILLILFIILIQSVAHMNSFHAYLAMALSSLIASFFALNRLGISLMGKSASEVGLDRVAVNRELWIFGKWIFFAYLASWFTSLSFPFFITILVNPQSAGAFRALQNLFLPFQQLLASITLLTLPWLSRQNSEYGSKRLFAVTQAVAGITGAIAVIYCLLTVIFRSKIVAFLYSNEFYESFDNVALALAISTLLGSVPLILGLALRVLGQPNAILLSKGYAAIFTFLIGIPMIWIFRMNGVIISIIGGAFIEVCVLLFSYFRLKNTAILLFS